MIVISPPLLDLITSIPLRVPQALTKLGVRILRSQWYKWGVQ